MFKIVGSYAFRNIFRMRMRSFFTVFSIVLVMALYTVLSSIGASFTTQIKKIIDNQNVDIAIQARYASSPISSIIDSSTAQQISSLQEVRSADALLIERKRIKKDVSIFILGISNYQIFAQRFGLNMIKGRVLREGANELVVGEKMANVLHLQIGDFFQLENKTKYKIVGIYSSWLNFFNAGLLVDLKSAQSLVSKKGKVNILFLTLKDTLKTQALVKQLNTDYPRLRAVESAQFPNYLGPIKSTFYFSKIVSLLTLLIAIGVLLNTFIMAISERTKEIGILNAIGWPKQMIVSVFFIEAIILSFVGSILGYISAFPIMYLIQKNFTNISMYLPSSPDLSVFINVLLMSFIIGIVSILFPALYSTKIEIAKAIRHE